MRSRSFAGGQRLIAWNGLHLALPAGWEAMVCGPHHLLLECNFAPVLEIRWAADAKGSPEDILATARHRFTAPHQDVRRIDPPQPLAALSARRGITWLSWQDGGRPDGLLWQCPECGTVVLCRLYRHQPEMASPVAAVLDSIQCHRSTDAPSLWSIQDFQLILPPEYSFTDSTFAAGLSRLAFSGKGLGLQFCRLAPAATRLAASSLPQLLGTLIGGQLPEEALADAHEVYEWSNRPPASRRFLARLRRLPPFRWGRIWHDVPHNRLLAVTAESTTAIDLTLVHELCRHYEIISESVPPHPSTAANTEPR